MGSFSQGLLFVSCLSKCIQEIFITYSDRHLVGDGELWRSHNLQGMTVFTVPKILCKIVGVCTYPVFSFLLFVPCSASKCIGCMN